MRIDRIAAERFALAAAAALLCIVAGCSTRESEPKTAGETVSLQQAAEIVFRVCHQLHGAVGFCDETTLSWLSRYSQPLRRLPLGLSATRDELSHRVGRTGLTGLFS